MSKVYFSIYNNIEHVNFPEFEDISYSEIDEFGMDDFGKNSKEYEYNNCIAYEFAIRNNDILLNLEKFEEVFIQYEEKYDDLLYLSEFIDMNEFDLLQKSGFDLFAMTYWLFRKRAKKLPALSKLGNNKLCEKCESILSRKVKPPLYKDMQPILRLYNRAFKGCQIREGLSSNYAKFHNEILELRKDPSGKIVYKIEEPDDIWETKEWSDEIYEEDLKDEVIPMIQLSFRRPALKVANNHANFNILINMNMSKTNFKKYIEILKNEYDRRQNKDLNKLEDLKKEYKKLLVQTKYKDKKFIHNSFIFTSNNLNLHKNRVFTVKDLFRDMYGPTKKPSNIGGLGKERVKRLLYTWDCIQVAEDFNSKLETEFKKNCIEIKDNEEYGQEEKTQYKNEVTDYYDDKKIKIEALLDQLYINAKKSKLEISTIETSEEEPPDGHVFIQYRTALNKLIGYQEYKFLI